MLVTIYESFQWIARVGPWDGEGEVLARAWNCRLCYFRAKAALEEKGIALTTVQFEYK